MTTPRWKGIEREEKTTKAVVNKLQVHLGKRMPEEFKNFYPEIVVSYATGHRKDVDEPGTGPGVYDAAELVLALDAVGLACVTGLHVPPGTNWKHFLLRIDSEDAKAKVLIVLLSRALYRSMPCLEEISAAIKRGCAIIPVRTEKGLPPPKAEQWPLRELLPGKDIDDYKVKRYEVLDRFGALNCYPPQDTSLFELPAEDKDHLLEQVARKVGASIELAASPSSHATAAPSEPLAANVKLDAVDCEGVCTLLASLQFDELVPGARGEKLVGKDLRYLEVDDLKRYGLSSGVRCRRFLDEVKELSLSGVPPRLLKAKQAPQQPAKGGGTREGSGPEPAAGQAPAPSSKRVDSEVPPQTAAATAAAEPRTAPPLVRAAAEQLEALALAAGVGSAEALMGLEEAKWEKKTAVAAHAQAIAHLVAHNNAKLTNLDLDLTDVDNECVRLVSQALRADSCCLKELYLSGNQLTDVSGTALAEALRTNTKLQKLDLRRDQLTDVSGTALAEALRTNTSLKYLYLSGNQLTDVSGTALAEALRTNTKLQQLFLERDQLTDVSGTALAEALRTNTSLQVLDLSGNQLTDVSGTALAEALRTNTSLELLWLDGNQLTDASGTALAEALHTNTKLQTLYLHGNQLTDVSALAEALRTNTKLHHLRLGGNQLTDVSGTALAEALRTNTSLELLWLDGNQLTDVSALAEALRTNTKLHHLRLGRNKLSNAQTAAIKQAWEGSGRDSGRLSI